MAARHKKAAGPERTIALCYIRLSFTRDGDDTNSPDRQRANIQAMCDAKGWTPEWYEDTTGHKSGRTESGRPAWLALKERLTDTDVVALVANDLSRLHRKGWRIGSLMEMVEMHGVALTLASPGRQHIDTSTMQGKMFIQLAAMFDEYYAEDIAMRAKESIQHRKKRGISIGMPPFGSTRNDEGYLVPVTDGAWYLPDGTFVAGEPNVKPADNALWRGYYDCVRRVFDIYLQEQIGINKIAYRLNQEGWPFRDRRNKPRPITRDDVRRIVANWPEYGGIMMDEPAKRRLAYKKLNVDSLPFVEERAILPTDLMKRVALQRHQRSTEFPVDHSIKPSTPAYPLSAIVFCAHCARKARREHNPELRSKLVSNHTGEYFYYRHRPEVPCQCKKRRARHYVLEAEFARLVDLLAVRPDAREQLIALAREADAVAGPRISDFEQQKQEAIVLYTKKIEAAGVLYGDALITRKEYEKRVQENRRLILDWENQNAEQDSMTLEFSQAMDALQQLASIWQSTDDRMKQKLARHLFLYLEYDLDQGRITDFRLQPWAERFLIFRARLYEGTDKAVKRVVSWRESKGATRFFPWSRTYDCSYLLHRGVEPLFWP